MTSAFNPMDLSGRAILVTGASSGIGRAVAIYITRLGARVALFGRDRQRLAETAGLLNGGPHHVESVDLMNLLDIEPGISRAVEALGPLAGMVSCAGVASGNPIRYETIEEAERVMRVNWLAAWALVKAFRVSRRHVRPAAIVLISSVAAFVGRKTLSVYSSSKGALHSMTYALAAELADEGIRINCLAPGFVETPMTDAYFSRLTDEQKRGVLQRHALGLGRPEDVAAVAAFLLSDASRWMTGSVLCVDGEYSAL